MTTNKLRKEFEAWAKRTLGGDHRTNDQGEYINEDWEYPWWAWQASRAALVVDVPDDNDDRFWSQLDGPNEGGNSHIFLEGTFTDAVHEAIQAAGVRVKP